MLKRRFQFRALPQKHSSFEFYFTVALFVLGSSDGPATKKAKVDPAIGLAQLPFDVKEHIRNNTVDKLKVDELKQALRAVGVSPGTKKKAELVEEIYKNCNI